ncbi:LysE family translocator [Aliishimia ponticola]|uniref:LysE family translocator n=1 Tax=Aliishimia ponticola TaxID=2499833 RepID=A0A4S4N849_9RHOB|nr:LysE family translocator [Aliishimia ponticola]THH35366.1 LysE family translocator [Aliishimia ponticola]
MTASAFDLALYAFALFILFLTPGPVWLALIARAVSGGFQSAWPLAFGVVVGDVIWPLLAILGLAWITSEVDYAMSILRWVACAFFVWLGWTVIRNADASVSSDSRLTRPGKLAGFLAGVAVILSNPKAILFYLGVLPGFFDLSSVTALDIAAICFLSLLVPLIGNLILAYTVHHARSLIASPKAMYRLNLSSGWMLILVGAILPFT